MLSLNKKGDTGVSTLIIFIAMVLVAAVAALVLIQTITNLQSQATQTTSEASEQISTALLVTKITGHVDASKTSVDYLRITAKLAPGSRGIDLNNLLVNYSDSNTLKPGVRWLNSIALDNAESTFTAAFDAIATRPSDKFYAVRFLGKDDSYSATKIMENDQIEIWYNSPDANVSINAQIALTPVNGTDVPVTYKIPVSLIGNYAQVYPSVVQ